MKQKPFIFSTSVIAWPLFFVLTMWIVFWIEVRFKIDLSDFGIFPRTWSGLRGVILSPFLHGDLNHLYNNSIPLLFLNLYRDLPASPPGPAFCVYCPNQLYRLFTVSTVCS